MWEWYQTISMRIHFGINDYIQVTSHGIESRLETQLKAKEQESCFVSSATQFVSRVAGHVFLSVRRPDLLSSDIHKIDRHVAGFVESAPVGSWCIVDGATG
jgi:hypothetical protein